MEKTRTLSPAPGVWTAGLGENSVDLVIRAWTSSDDSWEAQTDLLRAIREHFEAAGISLPVPRRDLVFVQEPTAAGQS